MGERTAADLADFEVPGQPRGYYAKGARPNWTRAQQYIAWRRDVQMAAVAAGLRLPLRPTEAAPLEITIEVWYADRRPHSDPENTRKGVVDALTWAPPPLPKGDDRWVCGTVPLPQYDKAHPRVRVVVREVR